MACPPSDSFYSYHCGTGLCRKQTSKSSTADKPAAQATNGMQVFTKLAKARNLMLRK